MRGRSEGSGPSISTASDRGGFGDPIAIVGMASRFPGGADTPTRFWDLLVHGRDAIGEIPPDRWSIPAFYHPNPRAQGRSYAKWGGFLPRLDMFDPVPFGISPREARVLDPQQRLVLELAWESFEDAGIPRRIIARSRTGVFVGVSTGDYAQLQIDAMFAMEPNPHVGTGISLSVIANRVSYALDLQGPSLVVDTACSSSLVAVHLACESLRAGTSELALAGGVNLVMVPSNFIAFCNMGVLSPDGCCKAFDAAANGFVRGEGAGMVLLKPYSRARADGDRIYALILATGVNQDGHTNGLQVPNPEAQIELLEATLAGAGLDPADVRYVEAHGTGTTVGDPIEAAALGRVIGRAPGRTAPLCIGSVKTNLGHLESAAGVAGLIKTALVLEHGMVPPSLHFRTPNPAIDFDGLGLHVVSQAQPIPDGPGQVLAGVNSFGFGGTNAHAVLGPVFEAPRPRRRRKTFERPILLPLSAIDEERLKLLAATYRSLLAGGGADLRDVVTTASLRRDHLIHRLAAAGRRPEDLVAALDAYLDGSRPPFCPVGVADDDRPTRIAFVFSGQGTQWWGMGRGLFAAYPAYRNTLRRCDAVVRELAGWSLLEELAADEATSKMHDTAIAQVAICSLQIGLASTLRAWGLEPWAVVGHSVGEIAAAHAAGTLDLEDALTVAFHRGRLMGRHSGGAMASAILDPAQAEAECRAFPGVCVAAVNGPTSVTLAGPRDGLRALTEHLTTQGIGCRPLNVRYAFHSAAMDPVREPLLEALHEIAPRAPRHPMVSTVTGGVLDAGQPTDSYWWNNVRHSVRFRDAVEQLLDLGCTHVVELGAHPALIADTKKIARARVARCAVLPTLRRGEDEALALTALAGELYVNGVEPAWQAILPDGGRCISLPTYPWVREPYWRETAASLGARLPATTDPLLGTPVPGTYGRWENRIDLERIPYLAEHRLQNRPLFPAAGFIMAAFSAARALFALEAPELENVEFRSAMFLSEDHPTRLETQLDGPARDIRFTSGEPDTDEAPTMHCAAHVASHEAPATTGTFDPATAIARCSERHEGELVYRLCAETEIGYGPAFQGVRRFWRSGHEIVAEIETPQDIAPDVADSLHPAVLDACLQAMSLNRPLESWHENQVTFVPVRIDRIRAFPGSPTPRIWAHVVKCDDSVRYQRADLRVYDDAGRPLLAAEGVESWGMAAMRAGSGKLLEDWLHNVVWVEAGPATSATGYSPVLSVDDTTNPPSDAHGGIDVDSGHATRDASLRSTTPEPAPAQAWHLAWEAAWQDLEQGGPDLVCRARTPDADDDPYRGDVDESLDRVATAYVGRALAGLGVNPSTATPASLREIPGLAPERIHLVLPFLLSLSSPEACRSLACHDPDAALRQLLDARPNRVAEVTLLYRVGQALPELLQGTASADILYPGGARTLLEHFWWDSPAFAKRNRLGVAIAQAAVSLRSRRCPARLLFAGADTGGVAAHLMATYGASLARCVVSADSDDAVTSISTSLGEHLGASFRATTFDALAAEPADNEHFDLVLIGDDIARARGRAATFRSLAARLEPDGVLAAFDPVGMRGWLRLVTDIARDPDAAQPRGSLRRVLDRLPRAFRVAPPFAAENAEIHVQREAENPKAAARARRARLPVPLAAVQVEMELTASSVVTRPASGQRWLVLHGSDAAAGTGPSGLALALQEALRTRGADCTSRPVEPGSEYLRSAAGPWTGVVCLPPPGHTSADGSPSEPDAAEPELSELRARRRLLLEAPVHLLAEAENAPADKVPRMAFITIGGRRVRGDTVPVDPSHTMLTGLVASASVEMPDAFIRSIDLDPGRPLEGQVASLADEILSESLERDVALRDGNGRYVPRLVASPPDARHVPAAILAPESGFRLRPLGPGSTPTLAFVGGVRAEPGPAEVEVEVVAAALNFRDVLKFLGLYPADQPDYLVLGDECAGIVRSVGQDVTDLAPGDRVAVAHSGSFASHVVVDHRQAVLIPPALTFEEAATLPIAFLTASYALGEVARVQPGERVLIHAAAGGVGLAAVQLARALGAEVVATASESKRDFLGLLGVQNVFDSRSTSFAQGVHEHTNGEGVDVVLNSLSGEAIPEGMALLAPWGRFVEIGKRDIYENRQVGLRNLRRNASFHAVDLSSVLSGRPRTIDELQKQMQARLRDGTIRPLPHRVFSAGRLAEALRTMMKGHHIGKLIVSLRDPQLPVLVDEGHGVRPDGTYIITGGFGGVGLALAEAFVRRGARHLALVGRSGASTEQARRRLDRLRAVAGTHIEEVRADVGNPEAVDRMLARVRSRLSPLRGIVHAAMVLEDRTLAALDVDGLERVLGPKADGAWNLHLATRDLRLDHFFLTSSLASVLGSAGQAAYGAANAFLDGLTERRRALGLASSAVNFGPIGDVGVVAERTELAERFARIGLRSVGSSQAMDIIQRCLTRDSGQVAAFGLDAAAWRAMLGDRVPSVLDELMSAEAAAPSRTADIDDLRASLRASPEDARAGILADFLCARLARVLGSAAEGIDREAPLQHAGLDSLMAVELHHRLEHDLQLTIPQAEFAKHTSVNGLARFLLAALATSSPNTVAPMAMASASPQTQAGEHAATLPSSRPPVPSSHTGSDEAAPAACLILLRPGSSELAPLVCLHPAGGEVTPFRFLAGTLPEGRAVYGLASRQAVSASHELDGVREMARSYALLLRERFGSLTPHLLGFSFGTLLAFASAEELGKLGGPTPQVAAVEPLALPVKGAPWREAAQLFTASLASSGAVGSDLAAAMLARGAADEFAALAEEIMNGEPEARVDVLLKWATDRRLAPRGEDLATLRRHLVLAMRHLDMARAFDPADLDTPWWLWLARATESDLTANALKLSVPRRNPEGRIVLEGSHHALLTLPTVTLLAERLDAMLTGAERLVAVHSS